MRTESLRAQDLQAQPSNIRKRARIGWGDGAHKVMDFKAGTTPVDATILGSPSTEVGTLGEILGAWAGAVVEEQAETAA